MPVHDWTRVSDGTFHDFQYSWVLEIKRALKRGVLPDGYYVMVEQLGGDLGAPDVLTLQASGAPVRPERPISGTATITESPPAVHARATIARDPYARLQRTLVIRHTSDDRIVAMIEILSASDKSSRHALRSFLDKAVAALDGGVHLPSGRFTFRQCALKPLHALRRHLGVQQDESSKLGQPPTQGKIAREMGCCSARRAFEDYREQARQRRAKSGQQSVRASESAIHGSGLIRPSIPASRRTGGIADHPTCFRRLRVACVAPRLPTSSIPLDSGVRKADVDFLANATEIPLRSR